AFVKAGVDAGYKYTDDFNGPSQEGIGFYQELDNLVVQPKASATRVLMEGKRAVGVEWAINGNANRLDQAFAEGSVILAGGAINSPQLLMLSGIGPAEELKKHNINVVLDAPGVGQNLQ
ncbi:CHDH, partial [Symbiodinium sp. KB8]